ncbi:MULTISPECIES: TOMM precursor leader peptide-binding protein [Paraburkholderia]|uniref:TOMM precursor leader peptide-binding protein n=1 Tax=Paraburkholderia TaxID=1822464 RepID=UPI002253EBBF|nr:MULTISPECIES: TOMM precursor leader peptide-binding protein [Paraburkholderia]MCX4161523.1 TOMM precursor leader peptide-binding protein [Paraburkholderia megapolitana]MDN7157019.1 TOMM precursor leader peptide-binding protein [Paraburkholderia sp. CHISQ3]MDQ6494064.1 TOMM precursor leader peptide-binding protein [Paraburkholderia megapolitana]
MLDDFTRVLRFKPHLLVLDAGTDALFIVDEFKRTLLSGAVYVRIAACLRERMTTADIFAALAATFSDGQILAALDHLVQKRYLRADAPDSFDLARGFFERAGLDGDAACERVAQLHVAVKAFGVDASAQLQAFAACGIEVVEEAPLTIAICDAYDRPELADTVERTMARGGALLLVMPEGVQPLIGPLLAAPAAPHEPTAVNAAKSPPCLECTKYWIARNRPVQTLLGRYHDAAATRMRPAHSRAGMAAVSALVVACVEQLAASRECWEQARTHITALRLDTLATARHRVVRRPQCPRCGNPQWMREQAERAPQLSATTGVAGGDGGYRTADPQQVFQRYAHLISPVTGAVAYLHPMPKRHAGLRKVYVAGYLTCPDRVPDNNRFDKICSGKGRSDEQARVSALCETLERFSGVFQGDEAVTRGSLADLSRREQHEGAVLHVNALQQFSDRQFEQRAIINAQTDDVRKQVPPRFTEHSVIDWTTAWSLTTRTRRWVPLNYCYADVPDTGDVAFCIHNPNGSAAGSCIEEAILQGLLELVERDAAAIWWYNQIPRPGVDLASFADPYFDSLQNEYAAMGWDLWALDITHDLRIPTIVGLAEHRASGRFSIGFGCHPDSRIAVQRALTEVNQLLDPTSDGPPPWNHAKLSSTAFLYPAQGSVSTQASTWPPAREANLLDSIAACVARVSSVGLDTLVVDKTRPDIGLPVVQVIVPGLCHFWPRFGAPRLYAVPVQQGWIERPRDESELNQALLFL